MLMAFQELLDELEETLDEQVEGVGVTGEQDLVHRLQTHQHVSAEEIVRELFRSHDNEKAPFSV